MYGQNTNITNNTTLKPYYSTTTPIVDKFNDRKVFVIFFCFNFGVVITFMSVMSIARGDKDELAMNSGPFDLITTTWLILSFEFVVSFVRRTFKLEGRVENFMPFNSAKRKIIFVFTSCLFFVVVGSNRTWHRTTA